MKKIHTFHPARLLRALPLCMACLLSPLSALASVFSGGDPEDGLGAAENVRVGGNSDLRETAVSIIQAILSFMGIIAVFVIVIAGIMLVVGGGSDESRQRTLKIIMYTLIGLLVILLASAFVAFVIDAGTGG